MNNVHVMEETCSCDGGHCSCDGGDIVHVMEETSMEETLFM